jgi:hypothetical protein
MYFTLSNVVGANDEFGFPESRGPNQLYWPDGYGHYSMEK